MVVVGIDFAADGSQIYVSNFFSSMVTIVNLPDIAARQFVATGSNPDSAIIQPEEIFELRFASNGELISWPRNFVADRYHVYRGDVAGLPDYGSCIDLADPVPTDTQFTDPEVPASGEAFFYLVSIGIDGDEGVLGHATDGTLRLPDPRCVVP